MSAYQALQEAVLNLSAKQNEMSDEAAIRNVPWSRVFLKRLDLIRDFFNPSLAAELGPDRYMAVRDSFQKFYIEVLLMAQSGKYSRVSVPVPTRRKNELLKKLRDSIQA